jgi:AraC-like DNA-binding protein
VRELRVIRRPPHRRRHAPLGRIPSHRHLSPYATLVLGGGYVEAGESGRWRIEHGTVVVHAAGEAHADWFGDRTTELIDFDVPEGIAAGAYRCDDADALAKAVLEGDTSAILPAALVRVPGEADWPDLLAAALRGNPALAIGDWAAEHGLRRETVSRGFAQAYGVTAARYRLGVRISSAVKSLTGGDAPLAEVAFANGFADQPHMTRALRSALGRTPAELRSVKSVQE